MNWITLHRSGWILARSIRGGAIIRKLDVVGNWYNSVTGCVWSELLRFDRYCTHVPSFLIILYSKQIIYTLVQSGGVRCETGIETGSVHYIRNGLGQAPIWDGSLMEVLLMTVWVPYEAAPYEDFWLEPGSGPGREKTGHPRSRAYHVGAEKGVMSTLSVWRLKLQFKRTF